MNFNQKWIGQALKNFFGKDNITQEDVSKIKYLQIGESFENDFIIALSEEYPPEPFSDTDGGDEWIFALRGENIQKFLENPDTNLNQLSFWEFEQAEDLYAQSEKAVQNWEKYKKSIYREHYCEQTENEDKWEQWYYDVSHSLYKDLKLFSGLVVLRIQGLGLPDYTIFEEMKNLKVLELIEIYFESSNGKENLYNLNQLACWFD